MDTKSSSVSVAVHVCVLYKTLKPLWSRTANCSFFVAERKTFVNRNAFLFIMSQRLTLYCSCLIILLLLVSLHAAYPPPHVSVTVQGGDLD